MSITPRQIDKNGVWIANLSEYRFVHGTREGVVFNPKQPTKVVMDEWIKSQAPILMEVEDPFAELPATPVIKESPLLKVDDLTPATGVGTGPEGSGNGDDVRRKQDADKKPAGDSKVEKK